MLCPRRAVELCVVSLLSSWLSLATHSQGCLCRPRNTNVSFPCADFGRPYSNRLSVSGAFADRNQHCGHYSDALEEEIEAPTRTAPSRVMVGTRSVYLPPALLLRFAGSNSSTAEPQPGLSEEHGSRFLSSTSPLSSLFTLACKVVVKQYSATTLGSQPPKHYSHHKPLCHQALLCKPHTFAPRLLCNHTLLRNRTPHPAPNTICKHALLQPPSTLQPLFSAHTLLRTLWFATTHSAPNTYSTTTHSTPADF